MKRRTTKKPAGWTATSDDVKPVIDEDYYLGGGRVNRRVKRRNRKATVLVSEPVMHLFDAVMQKELHFLASINYYMRENP